MPIDPAAIGLVTPSHTVDVEAGALRFFAKAIGETDPVYTDAEAAKAAGHRGLPVPPTFLFSLNLQAPDPFALVTALGVDLRRVLHAEQGFTYHAPCYAGDRLTFTTTVADIYSKKGGALEFVVQKTAVTRDQDELVAELVAELTCTLVVRNTEAGAR